MNQPRSIFTGSDTATRWATSPGSIRRLSSSEHRDPPKRPQDLSPPQSPSPAQSTPAPHPRERPTLFAIPKAKHHPLWTPTSPLDLRDSFPRPLSAPLHSAGGGSTATFRLPPVLAGQKRPLAQPPAEPLHKRRRLQTRSLYTLDHFNLPKTSPFLVNEQPPSPLFFSSSRSQAVRPQLPPRFSSSEAAAKMLSKTLAEEGGIKTVTLPRGTFSALSPPGTASARNSERSSVPSPMSPEVRDKNDPLRILATVGIVELLELDPRPTFIIDTGDPASPAFEQSSLQIFFANTALRSSSSAWDLITGKLPDDKSDQGATLTANQFRNWLLNTATQSELSDGTPPPTQIGGLVWSCYTLRKRLRVISGTITAQAAAANITPMSDPTDFVVASTPSIDIIPGNSVETSLSSVSTSEPQDYFGEPPSIKFTEEESSMPISTPRESSPTDESGIFKKPSQINLPPEAPQSFVNECVLRAHTAGDIDAFHREPRTSEKHDMGFFDWTRLSLSSSLPRHIQFARSIDWASTALGPIEYWSNDLRAMCNLIMASPHPAAMYWGDELVAIYNEAYIGLAGQKHPTLMGQSYKVAWAEIWDEVKEVFANARMTGQATMKDDDCLFMKRSGFLEETYFSWSIIPMVGEDGTVMGLYNPAFEKTRRKIAERRMLTLREIGERTAIARDVKGFWDQVLMALTENEFDTPFVMLYSVADDSDSDSSSLHSSSLLGAKQCFLEGSLGVPSGHQAAPDQIDLKEGHEGFGPVFREVMKTDKPVVISIGSGDLPQALMDGLEWRGFGDPCRDVVICPIHPTTGETILGFLVMGINPRRPYDDDYNLFVQLLSRQLATSLASVVLFEEEIRRGQKAAKLAAEDRFNLSEQLAARTQEARESETRFTRMAEYSPAGLFIADHSGLITYCNDTWFEISRVPKERDKTDRWIDYVKEEDQSLIKEHWKKLVDNAAPINVEFRFKAPWEDRNRNKGDLWVLFSAFPETNDNGQLKSVFGSITNISPQKWAEGFQKRKMEEAVELKRQQENFIDITSHEMRNPLSAILQCADEISTILSDFKSTGSSTIASSIVTDSIDAAQTIALCAQHQKRIVDDVLTLSKLDSAMLMVTPVDAQPLQVVQRALKMFESEVQTAGIQMEFVLTKSFNELGVDWVKIDPSRVLQVLINLTTNAIKFTTAEETRTIKVILSASRERPSAGQSPCVSYFPMRSKRVDQTIGPDWGDGEEIYLEFAVQDTGRGLSPEELKVLFQRFQQASPRTHVQYGGSGLGLFISRELTELQGGEIGVSSEAGKGSIFAFYVKCRRTDEPTEAVEGATGISLARKPSSARDRDKVMHPPRVKDFAAVSTQIKEESTATKEESTAKAQTPRLRVLIVEDNLVNQKVLQRQLHNQNIATTVANHGGEALEILKTSTYWRNAPEDALDLGVILMDKEMPVMDGLQCTSKIRELEEAGDFNCHVPIIAVTANARSEQIATLLAAGMDDVVSKPFRIGELIPKIEELAARFTTTTDLHHPLSLVVSNKQGRAPHGL